MTPDPHPPRWAETTLGLLLTPTDRDSVSGDLLEAYRETHLPARGRAGADAWYVRQVAGFAWRRLWVWIVLFAAACVSRDALDWLVPTRDFHVRSMVTTWVAVSLFCAAGFVAAWRSRSVGAATLAGAVISATTAAITLAYSLVFLAIRHDPTTMAAIAASGGLSEALTLPIVVVLPATMLATIGGLTGKGLSTLR